MKGFGAYLRQRRHLFLLLCLFTVIHIVVFPVCLLTGMISAVWNLGDKLLSLLSVSVPER